VEGQLVVAMLGIAQPLETRLVIALLAPAVGLWGRRADIFYRPSIAGSILQTPKP
jgi:hypothetical protein